MNRGGSKAGASKGFLRKSGLVSSEDETEASGDEVVTSPAKPKRAGGVAPTALQPAGGTGLKTGCTWHHNVKGLQGDPN